MAISPDDSQRCANELLAKDPFLIVSSLNFFGNQIPIYQAGRRARRSSARRSPSATSRPRASYSIGGGGGCLGVHTGLVEFATTGARGDQRIAVPWADTPPGVVCYYDLEAKPLDVLNGTVPGEGERAGSMPDLQHIGVPIKPATPDVTPQVTEVLGFDPDAIIFSAQGADCWNFVDGLGRLGWTPDSDPAGAVRRLHRLRGDGGRRRRWPRASTSSARPAPSPRTPTTIENPRDKFEAEIYQSKPLEYGLPRGRPAEGLRHPGLVGA